MDPSRGLGGLRANQEGKAGGAVPSPPGEDSCVPGGSPGGGVVWGVRRRSSLDSSCEGGVPCPVVAAGEASRDGGAPGAGCPPAAWREGVSCGEGARAGGSGGLTSSWEAMERGGVSRSCRFAGFGCCACWGDELAGARSRETSPPAPAAAPVIGGSGSCLLSAGPPFRFLVPLEVTGAGREVPAGAAGRRPSPLVDVSLPRCCASWRFRAASTAAPRRLGGPDDVGGGGSNIKLGFRAEAPLRLSNTPWEVRTWSCDEGGCLACCPSCAPPSESCCSCWAGRGGTGSTEG